MVGREDDVTSQPVEIKRTYCRVCITACGLVAEVAGDQILKVRGDKEHPLTKGYTCPKGRATGQIHHLEGAITRPMMRKDGELVEVGWDEALDDIAAKLRSIIDAYGPNAVAMYFGSGLGLDSSGYAMEEAFYRALGTPPKFSPLTIDGTAKTMLAAAMGGLPAQPQDRLRQRRAADLRRHQSDGQPRAQHGDVRPGVLDPGRRQARRGLDDRPGVHRRRRSCSTRHIAAYPGKDYAILAWVVREIIDGGPLRLRKQPVNGLAELRAALEGYDRAKAAEIAGVTEQELEDLLAAVRRKGRVAVETGTGITMSAGGNLTQWFAWLIMILTGSMNEKGGAWFHPGFLNAVRGLRAAGAPERLDARVEDAP